MTLVQYEELPARVIQGELLVWAFLLFWMTNIGLPGNQDSLFQGEWKGD